MTTDETWVIEDANAPNIEDASELTECIYTTGIHFRVLSRMDPLQVAQSRQLKNCYKLAREPQVELAWRNISFTSTTVS